MADPAKPPGKGGKSAAASPGAGQSGPPSMVSMEAALNGAIGAKIRVQTTNPNTPALEGTLFTICPTTSLMAISTTTPPAHHIIPISTLTSFTLLSPASSTVPPAPIAPINTKTLLARANAALIKAQKQASTINRDVGREAQEIFDGLYKQFPGTRWAGKDMVVLDMVLIKGPGYRSEDCRASSKSGEGALGRVKKVLENERRRVTQRESKTVESKPADTKPTEAKPKKPVIPAIPAIPAFNRERKGG